MQQLLKPVVPAATRVVLEVVHVERPAGDPVLNQQAWEQADDLVLDLPTRRRLEEHGFRVAVVGGQFAEALNPLVSDDDQRLVNAEHIELCSGTPTFVQTSDVHPQWPAVSGHDQHGQIHSYHDAVGTFRVVATIVQDRLVRLSLTPQIRYGQPHRRFVPELEGGRQLNWSIRVDRPVASLDELQFQVSVRRQEVLMVGSLPNRPGSLAERFFSGQREGRAVQRLLLIRAAAPSVD